MKSTVLRSLVLVLGSTALQAPVSQAGFKKSCQLLAATFDDPRAISASDELPSLVKKLRDARGKDRSDLLAQISRDFYAAGYAVYDLETFTAYLDMRTSVLSEIPFRAERDINGIVKALITMRGNLNASELGKVRELLSNAVGQAKMNDPRFDWSTEISDRFGLAMMQLAIDPSTFPAVLAAYPEHYVRGEMLMGTSTTMRLIVDAMPEVMRLQFIDMVRDRFTTMTVKGEKKNSTEDDDSVSGAKATRRQMDALLATLGRKELRQLITDLGSQPTEEAITTALNSYFGKVGVKTGGIERTAYDAQTLVDAAQIVADNLASDLDAQGQRFIQFYGSFPNGKASLKTSDIDFHFSGPMVEYYVAQFGTNDHHWAPNGKSKLSGGALQQHMLAAEQKLSAAFHQPQYREGGIISLSTDHPPEQGEMDNMALYSPILVKISRRGIELQIYDALDTKTLRTYTWR